MTEFLGDDVEVPVLAVQHYATDAAIHYRKGHTVVRVRLDDAQRLRNTRAHEVAVGN